MAGFHHVEGRIVDLKAARAEWGWLLRRVGFTLESEWSEGQSWTAGGAYLTLTTSPNLSGPAHDRRMPGVNHLAFKGGAAARVDTTMADAQERGWLPLYQEHYPHAGGSGHDAGWLENSAGFKAEIVADGTAAPRAATFAMTSLIRWFRNHCNDSAGPQMVTDLARRIGLVAAHAVRS